MLAEPGRRRLPAGRLRPRARCAAAPSDEITEAFRTGEGFGWHEHDEDVFVGCEQFFRPGYVANLVPSWIPALDGVEAKLRAGAKVADIGCGLGASTVLLADAVPELAARRLGLPRRARSSWPASVPRTPGWPTGSRSRSRRPRPSAAPGYDLVATFDCLHDMGDPLAAAGAHPAGHRAGRHLADRRAVRRRRRGRATSTRSGRVYYNFSTFLCVPNALSQPGGYALGAQAGEAAIRRVVTDAGFTRFRRVARDAVQPGLRGAAVAAWSPRVRASRTVSRR